MSAMLGNIRFSLAGRSMMVLPQEDAGLRIGPSIKRPRSGRNLKVRRSRAGAFDTRGGTWLRGSTALARRFEASTSGADRMRTKQTIITTHRHRGRLLLGAVSPCLSWTRSPASTAYCGNGVNVDLPHLPGGSPAGSMEGSPSGGLKHASQTSFKRAPR